jgi:hypothetical protein
MSVNNVAACSDAGGGRVGRGTASRKKRMHVASLNRGTRQKERTLAVEKKTAVCGFVCERKMDPPTFVASPPPSPLVPAPRPPPLSSSPRHALFCFYNHTTERRRQRRNRLTMACFFLLHTKHGSSPASLPSPKCGLAGAGGVCIVRARGQAEVARSPKGENEARRKGRPSSLPSLLHFSARAPRLALSTHTPGPAARPRAASTPKSRTHKPLPHGQHTPPLSWRRRRPPPSLFWFYWFLSLIENGETRVHGARPFTGRRRRPARRHRPRRRHCRPGSSGRRPPGRTRGPSAGCTGS